MERRRFIIVIGIIKIEKVKAGAERAPVEAEP